MSDASGTSDPKRQDAVRRVLIVEDTAMIRRLLVMSLTQAQFEVIEAENGEQALQKISDSCPDIILSDINMPIMDGRELLRQVRMNNDNAQIPVLMLSADFDAELEREMLSLGAAKLLVKTGSRKDLISTINDLISRA